jgi:hypothetical protein
MDNEVDEEIEKRRRFFANPPERHVCGLCGRRHYRGSYLQYDHDNQQPKDKNNS